MQKVKQVVFSLLRIWVGYSWLHAGLGKIGSPVWTGDKAGVAITGFFKGAIGKAVGEHPAVQQWYADFLQNVALPHAKLFSYLVPIGEVLVGIALLLGTFTTFAAIMGAFMNLNFMLAGSTSTNPILYTAAVLILFAGAAAGYYGVDRFLAPYVWPLVDKGKKLVTGQA